MLLNVCAMIIIIISETMAYNHEELSPNVGTVLFSPDDRNRQEWTKAQISLLRARRYFQTILPPASLLNDFNENFGNVLLNYFKNAYSHIKREATDHETDRIMTAALSDALGGYLKIWILPVAKLDYYGGTVSQDHVVKLFQFYDEIKSYLNTDGYGWRGPRDEYLNSLSINIAPISTTDTRSTKNPCDELAYFEKTPDGLRIPLPKVNWDNRASTMFVPLKNVSLISMTAPDKSNALVKYYNIAKRCLAETNPTEFDEFDGKFQTWLRSNILPHLQDDLLYLGLGNVLTVMNNTYNNRGIVETLNRIPMKFGCKPIINMSSKKLKVLFIILLLEVIWCIPALICVLCTKKKKNSSSNVYMYIDHNKSVRKSEMYSSKCPPSDECANKRQSPDPKQKKGLLSKFSCLNFRKSGPCSSSCSDPQDIKTECPPRQPDNACTNTSKLQLSNKTHTFYTEFESRYATVTGKRSQSYSSPRQQSSESTTLMEKNYAPKKSSLKKPHESSTRVIQNARLFVDPNQEEKSPRDSKLGVETFPSSRRTQLKKSSHSKYIELSKRSNHNKDSTNSKRNAQSRNPENVEIKRNKQSRDAKHRDEKSFEILHAPTASTRTSKTESIDTSESQFSKTITYGSETQQTNHPIDTSSTYTCTAFFTSNTGTSQDDLLTSVTKMENTSDDTRDKYIENKSNEADEPTTSKPKKTSLKVLEVTRQIHDECQTQGGSLATSGTTLGSLTSSSYQEKSLTGDSKNDIIEENLLT